MAKFMCLFRNDPTMFRTISPEQMQQMMQKWMSWKDTLEKSGHVKQFGERMDLSGKVIRGKSKSVTDGPYIEVKDSVQGSLLLEANDLAQAVDLAKGCPILESDGSVEVRPIITA